MAFDPPYVHAAHPRMMFSYRYNGGHAAENVTVDDIMALYRAGMDEGRRVLKPRGRLFVKTMDQVENGAQRWLHLELEAYARTLGMFARDLFVMVPTAAPNFRRWKRQIHARKSHSFLWIFERKAGSGRGCEAAP